MPNKPLEPKLPEGMYYIQNKHAQYLGNSPTWYAKDGKGYTAYILGAERFTKEQAEQFLREDASKWKAYNCAHVDARLHLIYDAQDDRSLGTDEPCGWPSGYAAIDPSLKKQNEELREALRSAAMTAHAHNKSFCHGSFEECSNCKNWSDIITKASA